MNSALRSSNSTPRRYVSRASASGSLGEDVPLLAIRVLNSELEQLELLQGGSVLIDEWVELVDERRELVLEVLVVGEIPSPQLDVDPVLPPRVRAIREAARASAHTREASRVPPAGGPGGEGPPGAGCEGPPIRVDPGRGQVPSGARPRPPSSTRA